MKLYIAKMNSNIILDTHCDIDASKHSQQHDVMPHIMPYTSKRTLFHSEQCIVVSIFVKYFIMQYASSAMWLKMIHEFKSRELLLHVMYTWNISLLLYLVEIMFAFH